MPPLAGPGGSSPAFWRSLDELCDTPEFRRFVENEFPASAEEMLEPASRRSFLKLMGASVALAGLTGCRWPAEPIVPFAHRPEGYTPGEPRFYATAMELGAVATGLLVTSYDGRPIKIEGNPEHGQSLGATSAWHQASLLELYDPDRSQRPTRRDAGPTRWEEFIAFARLHFDPQRASGGSRLAVLAEPSSSPSREELRGRLGAAFPQARWFEYDPLSRDTLRAGATLAFGAPYRAHLALDRAETILCLDEDLLLHHPSAVRYARDLVAARAPNGERFGRLHVVESCFSLTGSVADRRHAIPQRAIPVYALCLAAELCLEHGVSLPAGAESLAGLLERARAHPLAPTVDHGLVRELAERRGRSVVAAGPALPAETHALIHVLNAALGNFGRTVTYSAESDPLRASHVEQIRSLAEEIGRGSIDTLVILGGNPVYDAPAELGFGELLARVPTTIRLGTYEDETSAACTWHLPRAHYLESWGDARDWRGTVSIVQPLIEPLYAGRSDIELLALVVGDPPLGGYDIVRRTFLAAGAGSDPERAWHETLHAGLRAGSAWPEVLPALGAATLGERLAPLLADGAPPAPGRCELVFRPGPLHDGRFANNAWLQELPEPLTKLTWDNAALLAPQTAVALGVQHGDVVRVSRDDVGVELPVFLLPGQAPGAIGVTLGYGRTRAGAVGTGRGVDVRKLGVSPDRAWVEVEVERTGRRYALATAQDHFAIDALGDRERRERAGVIVREIERGAYRRDPAHALPRAHEREEHQLWKAHEYTGHAWGMAIDLNSCIGCAACVVACQAENNIPVVGKEQVARGREMHWIRVDRYFSGEPEAPAVSHQPVTCQHCENAPCEQVCPVAATVHDASGLNVMVYNRCIGTRYCSNNCPYKVRRFNYFNHHKHDTAVQTLIYNPEVTVRSRGVMEKCTFCLQRIQRAKIRVRNEQLRDGDPVAGGTIPDGTIVPACAQACPTQAILFGDLNDERSRVRAAHDDPRAYALLGEYNFRPRTRYLARLRDRGGDAEGAT